MACGADRSGSPGAARRIPRLAGSGPGWTTPHWSKVVQGGPGCSRVVRAARRGRGPAHHPGAVRNRRARRFRVDWPSIGRYSLHAARTQLGGPPPGSPKWESLRTPILETRAAAHPAESGLHVDCTGQYSANRRGIVLRVDCAPLRDDGLGPSHAALPGPPWNTLDHPGPPWTSEGWSSLVHCPPAWGCAAPPLETRCDRRHMPLRTV